MVFDSAHYKRQEDDDLETGQHEQKAETPKKASSRRSKKDLIPNIVTGPGPADGAGQASAQPLEISKDFNLVRYPEFLSFCN